MSALKLRRARPADLAPVIAIDARATGLAKPGYWAGILRRYGRGARSRFLVAEAEGRIVGYIVGEVRDWEFGSPPCGWVFVLGVRPQARLPRIGRRVARTIRAPFPRAGG